VSVERSSGEAFRQVWQVVMQSRSCPASAANRADGTSNEGRAYHDAKIPACIKNEHRHDKQSSVLELMPLMRVSSYCIMNKSSEMKRSMISPTRNQYIRPLGSNLQVVSNIPTSLGWKDHAVFLPFPNRSKC
jgi:hypothetical protein